jgi:hypothetical protein
MENPARTSLPLSSALDDERHHLAAKIGELSFRGAPGSRNCRRDTKAVLSREAEKRRIRARRRYGSGLMPIA